MSEQGRQSAHVHQEKVRDTPDLARGASSSVLGTCGKSRQFEVLVSPGEGDDVLGFWALAGEAVARTVARRERGRTTSEEDANASIMGAERVFCRSRTRRCAAARGRGGL